MWLSVSFDLGDRKHRHFLSPSTRSGAWHQKVAKVCECGDEPAPEVPGTGAAHTDSRRQCPLFAYDESLTLLMTDVQNS